MTSHYDRDTLSDYLHGALAPEADAAVFAHLSTCPACTALYDEEARLSEILRAAARAEELAFPSLVKARVWDALRSERPSWVERLRTSWGPRIAVPVAAAVALAAYFGGPVVRDRGSVGVEASYFLDVHNAEAQQNPLGPGVTPAVYTTDQERAAGATAASYIDAADAATLDSADGAIR